MDAKCVGELRWILASLLPIKIKNFWDVYLFNGSSKSHYTQNAVKGVWQDKWKNIIIEGKASDRG